MPHVPSELLQWAELLAKLGQFLFGLCTLTIAVWAATIKRKDFFRSELDKKRLDELGQIRTALQSMFFDFNYLHSTSEIMRTMDWNLKALKENDPDSWNQYERFKNTARELFYKFSDSEYYLFPDWIDRERRKKFAKSMLAFAPFTLSAATSKSQAQRDQFAVDIAEMKKHFDEALRSHA